MARGETRGQRRKRQRRARTASAPYPDHSKEPKPPSEDEELAAALRGQPAWVKAIWATPGCRLALSVGWVAAACWLLEWALTDPDDYFHRPLSIGGFVAAPLLVLMFGLQVVEAARDLVLKQDSVPVFHRLGWWLDKRGSALVVGYLIVMVVVIALID